MLARNCLDEANRGGKRDEQVDELMDALGRMLSR